MLESKATNESRLRSSSNFLGILNDIKRRPEDAAKELSVSMELIQSIIDGTSDIPSSLIDKAIKQFDKEVKLNKFPLGKNSF